MKDLLIKTVKQAEDIPQNNLRKFLEDALKSDLLVQTAFFSLFKENYNEYRKQFVFSKEEEKRAVLEFLEEQGIVEVNEIVNSLCDLEQNYAREFVIALIRDKKIKYEDIDPEKFDTILDNDFVIFFSNATNIFEFEGSCYFSKGQILFFDSPTLTENSSGALSNIVVQAIRKFNLTTDPNNDYEKIKILIKINSDGTLSHTISKKNIPISKAHSLFFYSIFARQRARVLENKILHYIDHIDENSNFEHLISVIRQFHEFIGVDENTHVYNLHSKTLKLIRNYNGHATLENEPEKNFLINFVKQKNEIDKVSLEIEATILETLELFDIKVSLDKQKIKNLLIKDLEDVVYETSNFDYIIEVIRLHDFSNIPDFLTKEPFVKMKDAYLSEVDKINADKSLDKVGRERKLNKLKKNHDLRCSLKLDFENNVLDFQVNGLPMGSAFWFEVHSVPFTK